jgi:hypothetical protein
MQGSTYARRKGESTSRQFAATCEPLARCDPSPAAVLLN